MNWRAFLEEVSRTVSNSGDLLPDHKRSPDEWLGFGPASPTAIETAENKLGVNFPASYKRFLEMTDGFKQLSCFLWDIYPVEKIGWLKDVDPEFHEIVTEFQEVLVEEEYQNNYTETQSSVHFNNDHLANCLVISDWGDAAFMLLNPAVKFDDEWEAWVYANWYPGARRYQSFEKLMTGEFESFVRLLEKR